MSNIDNPDGLSPVGHLNGSPYNGAANRYYIPASDSTAMFVGDAVKSAGDADANGVPSIAQAAAGDALRGVIVGFEPDHDNLTNLHRLASTARYALVCDDPDVVFEAQEDGAMTSANIGNNVDLVVAAGNTRTGRSGMELDSSTAATTAATARVLGLAPNPNNAIGTNGRYRVLIVEHELKSTAGA